MSQSCHGASAEGTSSDKDREDLETSNSSCDGSVLHQPYAGHVDAKLDGRRNQIYGGDSVSFADQC